MLSPDFFVIANLPVPVRKVKQSETRPRAFFDLIDLDRRSKLLFCRIFACADLRFFRSTGIHLSGKRSRWHHWLDYRAVLARTKSRKSMLAMGVSVMLALPLGGCLRPLYGADIQGMSLDQNLKSIKVEPVTVPVGQERLSHYLRNELAFALGEEGQNTPIKRWKLTVRATERVQSPIVNTITGRAESATLLGEAEYVLETLNGKVMLTKGKAFASITYDRNIQRFATVRAARDAEIRLARLLSEQIKTRLAITLSQRP
jgi:LPS-assembly lipoprotein